MSPIFDILTIHIAFFGISQRIAAKMQRNAIREIQEKFVIFKPG